MSGSAYIQQAESLANAIEIAIDAFKKFPSENWNMDHVWRLIDTYSSWEKTVLNSGPRYKSVESLSYTSNRVFSFFQETSGDIVNYFWQKIKENNLPFDRENKLDKILKRQKIKDQAEYDFITGTMVPFQLDGIIGDEEVMMLGRLMLAYEQDQSDITTV